MKLDNIEDLKRLEDEYQAVLNKIADKMGRKPPNENHAIVLETINRLMMMWIAELWIILTSHIKITEFAAVWSGLWQSFMNQSSRNNAVIFKLIYNLGRLDAVPHIELTGKLQQDTIDWIKDLGNITPEQIREWSPTDVTDGIDKAFEEFKPLPSHLASKLREILEESDKENKDE